MTDNTVTNNPDLEKQTTASPENHSGNNADTAAQTETAQAETPRQENGQGSKPPCQSRCSRHDDPDRQRRWKRIGAVILLLFVGFFFGRMSAHHAGDHGGWKHGRYERGGYATELRSGYPNSMSRILDGIGATPEQREKAVNLFR
ncbi:MAG: hypothetical protein KDI15_12005 [Thiothrix sp.]|nr:hypothetical protein [Thiothrix sp.]HPE58789.1 hypothetical protein [Thiolinea sp.]